MARYQLVLAYDGTEFRGFQRQKQGIRTVQGVLESTLKQLGWPGRSVLAAGRTDSGVHAAGQVVAFDLNWRHSPDALQAALNAALPEDVAVKTVQPARDDFHPRFDAIARHYQYRLFCQPIRDPLRERYAWRVWPAVRLESLQVSARDLSGTHDFMAFGTPSRTGGNTVRSVTLAEWKAGENELVFEIVANAFLYRMVRRLVYVQVAIGQGRLGADALRQNLEAHVQKMVQGLAPSQGLTLVEVIYPPQAEAAARIIN